MLRDPEVIKQLTIKDFEYFENHPMHIDDKADAMFGSSLFFMHGEKWRDMRSTLSPAFTGSKMRQMFGLIVEIAEDMMTNLKATAQRGERLNWEMRDLCSRYTVDVIATCAFGNKVDSLANKENEFYFAGEKFRKSMQGMKRLIILMLVIACPRLMKALGFSITDRQTEKFLKSMVLETMIEREKKHIIRPDMINILMQVRNHGRVIDSKDDVLADANDGTEISRRNVKHQWTDDELVAQCFLFFIAGFGTVSHLLSFASYELAINTKYQDTLYEEVLELNKSLNGKSLTYDGLQKLKYMDQVISETLRKYPPSVLTDRMCNKNYVLHLDGKQIPIDKGVGFVVPIYALHRDPQYFPNPDVFDPERFSDENKQNIVQGTFIPFGMGPRSCIGEL